MDYLIWAADSPGSRRLRRVVDVRDVAALTVTVVEKSAETNGQRYIACGGSGGEQTIPDILHEHFPARRSVMAEESRGRAMLRALDFGRRKEGGCEEGREGVGEELDWI
jgi:hypothetical protein